jgi:hypothetical protein
MGSSRPWTHLCDLRGVPIDPDLGVVGDRLTFELRTPFRKYPIHIDSRDRIRYIRLYRTGSRPESLFNLS